MSGNSQSTEATNGTPCSPYPDCWDPAFYTRDERRRRRSNRGRGRGRVRRRRFREGDAYDDYADHPGPPGAHPGGPAAAAAGLHKTAAVKDGINGQFLKKPGMQRANKPAPVGRLRNKQDQ